MFAQSAPLEVVQPIWRATLPGSTQPVYLFRSPTGRCMFSIHGCAKATPAWYLGSLSLPPGFLPGPH